jgi:hypothetical protein
MSKHNRERRRKLWQSSGPPHRRPSPVYLIAGSISCQAMA